MPWSSPYSCRRSSFSSLDAVASTVAPARLASWMVASPTPLAPACTRTVSPGCRCPNSNRQSSAVPHGTGTHAASTMSSPSGTTHVTIDGVATRSACDPHNIVHTTRCPGCRSCTSAPTSAIVPAHWYPTTCGEVAISPPARLSVSPPSMLTASTSTSTSPGPHTGSGTSSYRNTLGGPVS